MALQSELDGVYMHTAMLHQKLSKAKRNKVGAVLVTSNGVVLTGYNGTPRGTPNGMENLVKGELVTKTEVLHAELNCILKAAKEGVSVENSTIYVTLSPCMHCSAMLIQLGVSRVVYAEEYRIPDSIEYLRDHGILVEKY